METKPENGFYTDFFLRGSYVHLRYVDENGVHRKRKDKIPATLYEIDENSDEDIKTVFGDPLKTVEFDNVFDARKHINQNKDENGNSSIYGFPRFEHTYLDTIYPGTDGVEFDFDKIRLIYFDIETEVENGGFPDPIRADERINAITLGYREKYYVFAMEDQNITAEYICSQMDEKLKITPDRIKVVQCEKESVLLSKFVTLWSKISPNIVSGWNCLPVDTPVFGKNEIMPASGVRGDDSLIDSDVKAVSPITQKCKYGLRLANGKTIYSSKEHVYPFRHGHRESYSNLKIGGKSLVSENDFTVEHVQREKKDGEEFFVEFPLYKNYQPGYKDLSLETAYLLGFIYTDGSLKKKGCEKSGYTLYQSDYDLLKTFDSQLNTSICGNAEKGFSRYCKRSIVGDFHYVVYDTKGRKRINTNMVSRFSHHQFMSFLSGMLDGDGTKHANSYILCNYISKEEINKISLLLQWNGIFSTQTKNLIRFSDIEDESLYLRKKNRWDGFKSSALKRKSSSKLCETSFKRVGESYWVRVKDVVNTGEYVDMVDMETDTHYFVAEGCRTHNSSTFDIPYTVNRLHTILGESAVEMLSPWGIVDEDESFNDFGQQEITYKIRGVADMDYLKVYKKYKLQKQEKYKLDHIAEVEVGVKKLDYSEYGSLHHLYRQNYPLFMAYNVQDVVLLFELERNLGFMELMAGIAYMSKVTFEETFMNVRIYDVLIASMFADHGIHVPSKVAKGRSDGYSGGYVKEALPGFYEWISSFDLASLYPNLLIQYNISPETKYRGEQFTLLPDDVINKTEAFKRAQAFADENDLTLACNGAMFVKDREGFFPAMMRKYFDQRKAAKKSMFEHKQQVENINKILAERTD